MRAYVRPEGVSKIIFQYANFNYYFFQDVFNENLDEQVERMAGRQILEEANNIIDYNMYTRWTCNVQIGVDDQGETQFRK